jgi:hypothetical protein
VFQRACSRPQKWFRGGADCVVGIPWTKHNREIEILQMNRSAISLHHCPDPAVTISSTKPCDNPVLQLSEDDRVGIAMEIREATVGNNMHIGIRPDETVSDKDGRPTGDLKIADLGVSPPIAAGQQAETNGCPGEMSLQGVVTLSDNQCAPQMLVRLIGHRDPQAADRWRRSRRLQPTNP